MSSNLRIKKICQFCYSEFVAKTTVTKYCCLRCAQRAYKQKEKDKKMERLKNDSSSKSLNESAAKKSLKSSKTVNSKKGEITGEIINDDVNGGENKNDVVTVSEAAKLLGVTRKTVYNMIKDKKIEATNINIRLTRIKKSSIDKLLTFDLSKSERSNTFDMSDVYTISEISKKFNVSSTYVYHTLNEYKVPKRNKGKFVVVPKNIVDLIFKNFM